MIKPEHRWSQRIVELALLKQQVDDEDNEKLWEYTAPELAATEAEIARVELALGEPLEPQYRGFLSIAGGWRAFAQDQDLFGPQDLLGSEWMRRARMLVDDILPEVFEDIGNQKTEFIPIAVSASQIDVFLLGRWNSGVQGKVLWFAGDLIETYDDFESFFDDSIVRMQLMLDEIRMGH